MKAMKSLGLFYLIGILSLSLLACGREDGSPPPSVAVTNTPLVAGTTPPSANPPVSATLAGKVVDGVIKGATVTAYQITNGGNGTVGDPIVAGPVTTDANGNFQLTVPDNNVPLLLESVGGIYTDWATGNTINLTTTDFLRAVVPNAVVNDAGPFTTQITPLTHMAAQLALQTIKNNGNSTTTFAINDANSKISRYFGNIDIIHTPLINLISFQVETIPPSFISFQSSIDYSLILGGFSQYAKDHGMNPFSLITALTNDVVADGVFDGKQGTTPLFVATASGNSTVPLDLTAGTSGLSTAITEFQNNGLGLCVFCGAYGFKISPTVLLVINDSNGLLTPLAVPSGVTGVAGNQQVTLSWFSVTDATLGTNASSYKIYMGTATGVTRDNGMLVASVTTNSYTITGLTNGTPYYFVVTAVFPNGDESFNSSQISVTPVAGALDLGFGTSGSGTVTTPIGTMSTAYALAVQENGTIVVAGNATFSGSPVFALARYTKDGSLDTGFGLTNSGTVTTPIGTNSTAYALTVETNGTILVAGSASTSPAISNFALARYLPNGALDPSFGITYGNRGTVITQIGNSSSAYALTVETSGTILVAGSALTSSGSVIALAAYDQDGNLDRAFGTTTGIVTTQVPGWTNSSAFALTVQLDGKIVVAGSASNPSGSSVFAVARYNADGSPDTTFGTGGIVTTQIATNGQDVAYALSIQPDGKIVVAGSSSTIPGSSVFAVARYHADGSPDTTFGAGGIVTTQIDTKTNSVDVAKGLAIQPDGKIVVAGSSSTSSSSVIAMVRYNTIDGTLDPAFGIGGIATTPTPVGMNSFANALVIQPTDGKIVAAGGSSIVAGPFFTLTRYLP